MILDKKFDGTLDQGNGCLIIFNDIKHDELYEESLKTMKNMSKVVDKLSQKAKMLWLYNKIYEILLINCK